MINIIDHYVKKNTSNGSCYIYFPNLSIIDSMWHKVNFLAKGSCVEFSIFLLLDWLPNWGQKTQPALLFMVRE